MTGPKRAEFKLHEALRACNEEELTESAKLQLAQYRVVKPDPLQEAARFGRYWNGEMTTDEVDMALAGRLLRGLMAWRIFG